MISKSDLKYFASLNQKKFRKNENKFIVEGMNSLEEGLKSKFKCEVIFYTKNFSEVYPEIFDTIENSSVEKILLKNSEFIKISDTKNPQGIAAVFQIPKKNKLTNITDTSVVYLDNVNDPGNLGTIIRTCDWFGVNTIFLSKGCAEYTNSKVVRSSAGSIFHLNIYDDASVENLKELRTEGYQIICSDLIGENIYNLDKPNKFVFVFSNEANGPSKEILEIADKKITIPRNGSAESLNVAVAAGIILSQLKK